MLPCVMGGGSCATLRVGAGVELGFLGKVLRLLKAMR